MGLSRKEIREVLNDIDDALDVENLDFDVDYDVSHYHMDGATIFDVTFDPDSLDDDCTPDYWFSDVEDALQDVANDWDGYSSTEDSTVFIRIDD